MRISFLSVALVASVFMVSCDKEETCECTTTYVTDDGAEYQPADTDTKITEGDCDDFDVKELDTPVEGVTKETDCEEK